MPNREKTEKLSVTVPREMAEQIRASAPPGEMSAFFTEAARRYLIYHRQRMALEKGFGAWKTENHSELMSPEHSTAYIRSLREAGKERLAQLGGRGGK